MKQYLQTQIKYKPTTCITRNQALEYILKYTANASRNAGYKKQLNMC